MLAQNTDLTKKINSQTVTVISRNRSYKYGYEFVSEDDYPKSDIIIFCKNWHSGDASTQVLKGDLTDKEAERLVLNNFCQD